MEIKLDGKYRTKGGVKVRRVLCVDRNKEDFPVVVEFENGDIYTYPIDGRSSHTIWSLVEVKPYEDFKIDDPVMVKATHENFWRKRHFAGVDSLGRPLAYKHGETSWTSTLEPMPWTECRKPTKEELES